MDRLSIKLNNFKNKVNKTKQLLMDMEIKDYNNSNNYPD